MSTLSKLETTTSFQPLSNESLLEMKKLKNIRKKLLNLEKEEVATFNPLKVKIFIEKKEDKKNDNKIKIPVTFKSYFEDFKKHRGFTNQIDSGLITPSTGGNSAQVEQVDSSDLVNSD